MAKYQIPIDPAGSWAPSRFVVLALLLVLLPAGIYIANDRGIQISTDGPGWASTVAAIVAAPASGGNSSDSGGSSGDSSGQADSWHSSPRLNASHIAAYKPQLSSRELDRGLVSFGDKSRARRVAAKLLAGQPVSVVAFGGSVTTGSFADDPDANGYVGLTLDWINRTFPHQRHALRNSGRGLTPSSYFALCPNKEAPADVDLIFLEFNINDNGGPGAPIRLAHERLVRKLLAFANRPAVVELVFFMFPYPNVTHSPSGLPYRGGGDEELGVLAQYYHLPWLSARSLVWDGLSETQLDPGARQLEQSKLEQMWNLNSGGRKDTTHPGTLGHRWLSELLIHWLSHTLQDVWQNPLEAEDEEAAQKALNIPMYKNNFELVGSSTCFVGEEIRELVASHDPAFEWLNEGTEERPKWGFVSSQPGSSLTVKINTTVPGKGPEGKVQLGIAHLRSYEHMGKFSLSCVEGCACEPKTVDGHLREPFSQMYFVPLIVTSSDACTFKLTVLNDTQSGEHKVKLLGVVLSENEDLLFQGDPNGELVRAMPDLV